MGWESAIDSVIGGSKSLELQAYALLKDQFEKQDFSRIPELKDLPKWERKKTEDEKAIVKVADNATNSILRYLALPDFDIPERNVHLIKLDEWKNTPATISVSAAHFSGFQAIFAKEEPRRIKLVRALMHEMFHFKLYNSVGFQFPSSSAILGGSRSGLRTTSRDGKTLHFMALNEALTEELTMLAWNYVMSDPDFTKEAHESKEIRRWNSAIFDDNTKKDLLDPNIYDIRVEGREARSPSDFQKPMVLSADARRMVGKLTWSHPAYPEERIILNTLIDKLYERNKAVFKNREDVFRIFADSAGTGRILPLRRCIDRTFGNGMFLKIANLDKRDAGRTSLAPSLAELQSFVENL